MSAVYLVSVDPRLDPVGQTPLDGIGIISSNKQSVERDDLNVEMGGQWQLAMPDLRSFLLPISGAPSFGRRLAENS